MIFGKIDYINLLPFHIFLKKSSMGNSFKKTVFFKQGVPSYINSKFQKRQVNAAFISSVKSNKKNAKTLPVGIVAKKRVKSVLVEEGSPKDDPASATSNALCKVLGLKGEVSIGDDALRKYIQNPDIYVDLALEWNKKYHLPFVFAVLCVNSHYGIYKKLSKNFIKQKIKIPQYILNDYSKKRGISAHEIKEYLKLISYKINKKEERGLKLFLKKSSNLGFKK
ncbi:MqnA/MqnD/SBP family protein [Sulfurospirillum sp. 1612]|uniref:MqnA/MqnD/SBP family protein n=1 Tax=Sulfurospirillum sp. 1612 TaxID=3094835 RepID=UPI002F949B7D